MLVGSTSRKISANTTSDSWGIPVDQMNTSADYYEISVTKLDATAAYPLTFVLEPHHANPLINEGTVDVQGKDVRGALLSAHANSSEYNDVTGMCCRVRPLNSVATTILLKLHATLSGDTLIGSSTVPIMVTVCGYQHLTEA